MLLSGTARTALAASFYWADEYVCVAAFQSRLAFDSAVVGEVGREPHKELLAEVGVRNLPPAELDYCFDAIAFLQEADGVVLFEVVVVIVGVGTELQFLDLHDMLLLLGVVLLFFLLVLVVSVVDGFGDGRHGGW